MTSRTTSTIEMKNKGTKSNSNSILNKTNTSSTKARKIKIVVLGKLGVGKKLFIVL